MKKSTMKLLGITSVALLLVTGCGKVPKLENGQDAVVTLKGGDISVDDLYKEMKERYALSVLIDLVDTDILEQKYETTKEMKNEVQDQVDLLIQQYGGEDKLLQVIQSSGFTSIDDLKEYYLLANKRSKAIEDYAKSKVSDSEVEEYYEEKIFGDISAKHILISPEVGSNATDAEKQEAEANALKKANEVISKLNNGESFDDLAKEYSSDESNKDKGGLLADFVHGDMVEEFEEAAKALEKGKYTTTPVKTQYGYHIIYKVDQKDKPKLDKVKDDIKEEIAKDNLNSDSTLQITALEELRKDYNISIQDDTLKDQYERYLKNAKNN